MAHRAWRLTVRHGSDVARESFDSLEDALAEARRRAATVLSEERLGTLSAFRDYEPSERVHARLEVSDGRFLRGREGGIDVMGDGEVVPYAGAIRKRPLEAGSLDEAIDRLRSALTDG